MQNDEKQQTVASPIEPVVMCRDDINTLFKNTFTRQRQLSSNSNFYIEGFDKHKLSTLLQAFAEELNLIRVKDT